MADIIEKVVEMSLSCKLDLWDSLMAQNKENRVAKVVRKLGNSIPRSAVIARVNGELWDMDRPFEEDSSLELLGFDVEEARAAFWNSASLLLGRALCQHYGAVSCGGAASSNGFHYDVYQENLRISPDDFPAVDEKIKAFIKEKVRFELLEVSVDSARELFMGNAFKLRILDNLETSSVVVYRCGDFVDLVEGPLIRDAGMIKAFMLTNANAAYWDGDAGNESLQRVHAVAFPDQKMMDEWKKEQEDAANRDHRKIGRDQSLFFFHPLSPGSAFWFPHGAKIYNGLQDFIRKQYRRRGFMEVVTPNLFNAKLWETSGHWEHYKDDMFLIDVEDEKWGLKPMNCPGHCLIFGHVPHTFNELPIRYADFGVIHRNEMSGALSGMTRVRRFMMDDAHIFCRPDQIASEFVGAMDFLSFVYERVFGFSFQLKLSTRPNGFLGDEATWDIAEAELQRVLDESGREWVLNTGDGAFYGPKIDVTITDALKRPYQCATIQLDFQLPERFDLHYFDDKGLKQRPVMIHRALLGSLERFTAVLAENYAGKWPFWLSPRQAAVIAIHDSVSDYAQSVRDRLYEEGFEVVFERDSGSTLNRKIRQAQLAQFNFVLVVGAKEKAAGSVNVRLRDEKAASEEVPLEDLIHRFHRYSSQYSRDV